MEKIYLAKSFSQILSKVVMVIFIMDTDLLIIGPSFNNTERALKYVTNPFKVFGSLIFRYFSLIDLWCTDFSKITIFSSYELNYRFRSFIHLGCSLIYSIHLNSSGPLMCYSISNYFCSASWLEREILDLYGIFFLGNSDMRRILTDYGFNGYPFRKAFPLVGYEEIYYNDEQAELIMTPVQFDQNFRSMFGQGSSAWVLHLILPVGTHLCFPTTCLETYIILLYRCLYGPEYYQ